MIFAFVAALAGVLVYVSFVRPHLVPKRFHTVVEGEIYRSGKMTPGALYRVAREKGIKTVIDFGADPLGSPGDIREARTAEALGLDRRRIELVGDATGDPNGYVEALRLMTDPDARPILVHCGAGTERTGCAIVLYRHIVEGVDMETALAEARAVGHDPKRNPRFGRVLEAWGGAIEEAFRNGTSIPFEGDESSEPISD